MAAANSGHCSSADDGPVPAAAHRQRVVASQARCQTGQREQIAEHDDRQGPAFDYTGQVQAQQRQS